MNEENEFYVYQVNTGGRNGRYMSILPMDVVKEKGLIAEAIVGELTADTQDVLPQDFKANPAFIRFLQWSISRHVSTNEAILDEAKRVKTGNIIVPDFRKPEENGSIAPEDIIGLVQVDDGKIMHFHCSPDYIAFTNKGFMKLDLFFKDRHETDLMNHIEKQGR